MNATWERLFDWLLRSSWQAAILVLVVLGVQWVFGKRLGPHWRAALWLLVILKLILPSAPASSFSLFNLASWRVTERPRLVSQPNGVNADSDAAIHIDLHGASKIAGIQGKDSLLSAGRTVAWAVWLAGAALLGARMTWQAVSSSALLKTAPKVKDPTVLDTFESAKRALGIKSASLIQTDFVASPAVYGYFSPRILLPTHMSSGFSAQELRHVFLHELAHVKRQDMLILWVVGVLKILHWFNPVLWFGFRRLAADRELACDELALSYAEEGERKPYGETILRLLQVCAGRQNAIGTAGILENRSQMLQRISMIANFHKRPRWSYPGLLLIGILGLVTLTEAKQQNQDSPPDTDQPNALSKSSSEEPGVPYGLQRAKSQASVSVAGQDESAQPLQPNGLQPDPIKKKLDEASSNLLEKLDAERVDRRFARDPEQYRNLQSLRDEIQSLEKRKADLERELQAQEARANANRSTAAEDEFQKRLGVTRTDVPSDGKNTPTAQDLARAQARDAFMRRYGLDPSRVPAPDRQPSSSNSSQQARDAFMRRYGLAPQNADSSKDPFQPSAGLTPKTGISGENLPLRIVIDANGILRFGSEGKQMTLDEVRAKLSEEAKQNPSLKLSIMADKRAPFGLIIKVMDAAKDASVKSVNAFAEDLESRSENR
jgi:beta-lactamase regulating signal transducer with metallopeptidase domain